MLKQLILMIFLSSNVLAGYVIPSLDNVLHRDNKSVEKSIYKGTEYSVLVWNIYKQARKGFYNEIDFIASHDISLFQEINETKKWDDFLVNFPVDYHFATSFLSDGVASGVGIFSKVELATVDFDRSSAREPFIKTPKMAIIGELDIFEKDENLMVVSIHGINFVRNKFFRGQIHRLVERLKSHKGPLIWAGDFNTWNKSRLWYMNYRLKELKLVKAKLKNQNYVKRFFRRPLDHIFTRGVQVSEAQALNRKRSSDHNPMTFKFEILD